MAKYLFAYSGGSAPSESERESVMAAWQSWLGGLGDSLVDMGNPFGPSRTVVPGGGSDGGASGLTGYSIVSAEDLAAAAEIAKGCPALNQGGSVEVYETVPVM